MRISLVWKVMGAFVLVSVLSVLSVGVFARYATGQQFDKIQDQQAVRIYTSLAEDHYKEYGTFSGLRVPRGGPGQGPGLILTSPSGTVLSGNGPFRTGDQIPEGMLNKGTDVKVNGVVVGKLVANQRLDGFNPRDREMLEQVFTAILYAMLATVVGSVLLGGLLSRLLLKPLQQLSVAIQQMRSGEVPTLTLKNPKDELGDVLVAFSEMGQAVSRSQHLRKQMTADIAHDLQTPLTVLRGYLEAMQEGTLKPTPERMKTLHQEAVHLSELVADLRTLSLADAGELQLQKIPLSPLELLEEARNSFLHLSESAGVQIQIQSTEDLPDAPMDPTRMLQVLKNLIGNALKYTPEGGTILLAAKALQHAVLLEVKDSGSGIAPEKLLLVFERFYRADESRSGHNSGLGLAICKSIVQAHGGTIQVESTPGQGTCFRLTLPL